MKNYTKLRRLNEHDNSPEWQNDPVLSNVLTMTVDSFLDKVKATDPQKYADIEQFIKTNQASLNPEPAAPSELPVPLPQGDLQSQVDELKAKIVELEAKLSSNGQDAPSAHQTEPGSTDYDMPVEEVPNFNQTVDQGMI